ncbi:uncharacterized protein LOC111084144, partial [Limulus polyphemus]|uniref:Uncharacterized protein LOC111084144 n=1 Tax=Limulus polyphemus TaxID=6850 RepID=A0ABM1RZ28_LIMPO
RIDVVGGSFEWKTTVFRVPNAIYEIVAKIEKPDRRPSWGAIQVVLLSTTPPAVSVRCQTPTLCYPFEPIGQKINPVRVGLVGLCSEDCDGALVFEWEMYGVNNSTETHLPEAREYIVGVNEQKMALSDDFFKIYYPTYGDFIAKLTVTNEDGYAGIADLFLHINKPPEGGTCQVDNTDGKALIDRFFVTCKDWEDPEGTDVEHFAFWTMNLDTGALLFLIYGPESKASLVLPYGDFQLGVDIKDKEEAVQRINITTVS